MRAIFLNITCRAKFYFNRFFSMTSEYVAETKDPNIIKLKEEYISFDINSKRQLYKCKKFVDPSTLTSWADHKLSTDNIDNTLKPLFKPFPEINKKIYLYERGDITNLEIDCIGNAANESLMGGGGVDGAIHKGAGPELLKECATLGGCATGDAKITGGYLLPAKYVIHTVGPKGENADKLEQCYCNSLNLMRKHNLKSIAFPCISTGIYGYPNEPAATVALSTVRQWMETDRGYMDVDYIIFCTYLPVDIKAYHKYLPVYFPQ